jgi:DNA-binding IclR family transcriptional regulator
MDQSVARALKIMEIVARAGGPVRMSKVADEAGLQKSTAHRILRSLVELGYIEQEAETGRYGASLKVWELGSDVAVAHPIKRAAAAFLQTLHKETGQTVSLLVPSGDDVLYLEKLVSPRAIRFSTRPGSRVPAPFTAGGKAMLAHNAEARAIVERVARIASAHRAIDPDTFMAELELVRSRGFSISHGNVGVVSFGCALMARAGGAAAALSVSAPIERVSSEAQLAETLMSTCAKLRETVGLL